MKKFLTLMIALSMMLISCVCHAEGTQQTGTVEWKTQHFVGQDGNETDRYYLTAVIEGKAVDGNGHEQKAYMRAFVEEAGVFFSLYAEGDRSPIFNSGDAASHPVYLQFQKKGLKTESTVIFGQNSSEWSFQNGQVSGSTIPDLIIREWAQSGTVDITIPFLGWGGKTDSVGTMVSFSIPAGRGNFPVLYSDAVLNNWTESREKSASPNSQETDMPMTLAESLAPVLTLPQSYSSPDLALNLDITLKKNNTTNPEMRLYVDGQYVGTIYEGQTFRERYSLPSGAHSISIEHKGAYHYVNTFSFDLLSDNATIKLSVKDHDVVGYYEVSVLQADVANWKETVK